MKDFKKYLVPFTAAAIMASSTFTVSNTQVHAETIASTVTATVIPENTTTVAFSVFKEKDLAETSSMGKFMASTAQIEKTADGKIYVYTVIKSAQLWKSFKTEVNGKMVDVEFLSEDKEADTKIVKFQLDSLNQVVKSEVAIQVGTQVLPQTTYTKFDVEEVQMPSQVVEIEKEFNIWNTYEKKRLSQVKDYIISPLVTFEKDKKKFVQFTIKDASYWDSLQTELSGKLFDATIVSEDKATNTRVYRFEINSEDKLTMLIIHLKQPGVYDTTHVKFLDLTKDVVVVDPNKVVSTTKYNYSLVTKSKKVKSAANDYVVKPIKVEKTQAGKYFATVTLKNASMWKSIKTDVNGKMTAVKIVSTNKAKNTKVIKFQVKSAKATTKTTFTLKTKIKKLAGNYTNYIKVGDERK